MAGLTPDLQVSLSWGSIAESFHSLRFLSVSCFQVILGLPGPRFPLSIMRVNSGELPLSAIPLCQLLPSLLGPPRPTLSINLYIKSCLDCMSIPSFSMRSRSSVPSRANSSVDLMVAVSCGLTLQICLIIALSFRCRHWRLGFVNGQVSLAWSIALHTYELYTRPRLERRVAGRENWFQLLEFLPGGFHTCCWKLTTT